ncbi:MAG: hypothetical protein R3C44_00640 [Chloroflexota bacterium]
MISASAVLIDHQGRVLLTEDPTSGTLIPPTVALEPGVLPSDTLAQTVRDVTGIIALPLRLTGSTPESGLNLSFRTIQRGGAIREENGQLVAGFSPPHLPTTNPSRRPAADRGRLIAAGRTGLRSGGNHTIRPFATCLRVIRHDTYQPAMGYPCEPDHQTVNGTVWLPQAGQGRNHLPSISVAAGDLPCSKAVG